jgi:hypothetical protein
MNRSLGNITSYLLYCIVFLCWSIQRNPPEWSIVFLGLPEPGFINNQTQRWGIVRSVKRFCHCLLCLLYSSYLRLVFQNLTYDPCPPKAVDCTVYTVHWTLRQILGHQAQRTTTTFLCSLYRTSSGTLPPAINAKNAQTGALKDPQGEPGLLMCCFFIIGSFNKAIIYIFWQKEQLSDQVFGDFQMNIYNQWWASYF